MDESDLPHLRRAVRAHLADRPAVAQSAETIHRHVGPQFSATLQHVKDAARFLTGLRQLEAIHDSLGGSTLYYRATPEGILAHERGT